MLDSCSNQLLSIEEFIGWGQRYPLKSGVDIRQFVLLLMQETVYIEQCGIKEDPDFLFMTCKMATNSVQYPANFKVVITVKDIIIEPMGGSAERRKVLANNLLVFARNALQLWTYDQKDAKENYKTAKLTFRNAMELEAFRLCRSNPPKIIARCRRQAICRSARTPLIS
jgi:hypothetical protein